jgi:hypothetical protein
VYGLIQEKKAMQVKIAKNIQKLFDMHTILMLTIFRFESPNKNQLLLSRLSGPANKQKNNLSGINDLSGLL